MKEHPIAYGSKSLSDTEKCYGAPKAEMLAAVYFIEKFEAFLCRAEFTLRTDNSALSWLKKYSMTTGIAARWIQRLDQFNFVVEHRKRERHQNADGLTKKTEFYERQEEQKKEAPEILPGFNFLARPTQYDEFPDLDQESEKKELQLPFSWQPAQCIWDEEEACLVPEDDWLMTQPLDSKDVTKPALEMCLLVKEYSAHKYKLTGLVRTQEQDYPIKMLNFLVDGEAVGRLPCDGILATKIRSYSSRYRDLFYKSKEGILKRRRRPMERLVARADVIILPQVFHLEVMQLAHDQQAHVGHDKTVASILQKFD